VQQVLAGTLTEQSRRCGRPDCRCADGEPHGPYAYFTRARPGEVRAGRGRHDVLRRRGTRKHQIPFGPFMIAGAFLVILVGTL
jgi:hypothetical protein